MRRFALRDGSMGRHPSKLCIFALPASAVEYSCTLPLPACQSADALPFRWVVAILSFGCLVGAVASGQQADRFGRVATTFWGGLTCTAGGVVQAMAQDLLWVYIGRFVCGIGIGTLSSIVPL